jgi:hypothetical protein
MASKVKYSIKSHKKMAGVAGLEPVTSAVTGQRSNQLSYTPAKGDVTLKNLCSNVKFWFDFYKS